MKIISRPESTNWSKKHTCDTCDAVLEIEPQDLEFHSDYRDGDSYKTQCPICSTNIWISANELPKLVKLEIQKKNKTRSSSNSTNYFDR